MESLVVHPENAEQLETVTAVLKALKVPFESRPETLPAHVLKSIEKSIEQFENGQSISFQRFKEKHFSKK